MNNLKLMTALAFSLFLGMTVTNVVTISKDIITEFTVEKDGNGSERG